MTTDSHFPRSLLLMLLLFLAACDRSAGPAPSTDQPSETKPAQTATATPVLAPDPFVDVQPGNGPADEVVAIQVGGLPAGQSVTLKASLQDDLGQQWESSAAFLAGESGIVDVATQAPISGTYDVADPMGLFWSMLPNAPGDEQPLFANFKSGAIPVTIAAEIEGEQVAATTVNRIRLQEGVETLTLAEDGLVGTFFSPAGEGPLPTGPFPTVITLGGSGGGTDTGKAAVLASHGYATLALDYFGGPGLPEELSEIPLEFFETAIEWLKSQAMVDEGRLGVVGTSRGGELALLLGATFPDLKAVVAYVPSGLVWGSLTSEGAGENAAWTYRGEPIPFVRMGNPATLSAAVIPVENTNGPILLISGEDDQLWPSTQLSEIVMVRLGEHDHPFPYEHLRYEDAGHLIGLPYWPATASPASHPLTGETMVFGGTAGGNARASAASWARVLEFLESHLKTAGL